MAFLALLVYALTVLPLPRDAVYGGAPSMCRAFFGGRLHDAFSSFSFSGVQC